MTISLLVRWPVKKNIPMKPYTKKQKRGLKFFNVSVKLNQ